MKTITGWLICQPGRRDEFLALTQAQVAATREEPGCTLFEYHRTDRNPDEIIMLEVFDSAEAHEIHRRAPHTFETQAIVRRLIAQLTLIEVVSDDVRRFDLDLIANPLGPYSPD